MDNVRILNGYSKDQQKELKNIKKVIDINDLLNILTGSPSDTRCGLIWEKYTSSEADERISIIRDILDFYTDKAKFAEPTKYYVQLIKNNDNSYINRNTVNGFCMASYYQPDGIFQTQFTEQEIKAIDPRYMAFAVPVEEN